MMQARYALGLIAIPCLVWACSSNSPPPKSATPTPVEPAASPWGQPATDGAPVASPLPPSPPPPPVAASTTPDAIPEHSANAGAAATPSQTAAPASPMQGELEKERAVNATNRSAIVNKVSAYNAPIQKCYDDAARTNGSLQGRVNVRFTVSPSGDVVALDSQGSTLADRTVVKCVMSVFSTMKFNPFDGQAVSIVYPIEFTQPR